MKECRYLKDNDEKCKRKILTGKYCWQHSDHKKVSYIIMFATLLSLFLNLGVIVEKVTNLLKAISEENASIVCNRDTDLGCSLNLDLDKVSRPVNHKYSTKDGFPTQSVGFSYGNSKTYYTTPVLPHDSLEIDPVLLGHRIPEYVESGHHIGGPYQIRIVNDAFHFKGQIHDIKNEEMLGWFDGNEFGVIKPCSFSWNKDEDGIEIMDRYGNVCFSVITVKNSGRIRTPYSFYYRGYYKYKDYYYIFNENQHRTKDLDEAMALIKKIRPVFDHYGENSLGKRTGFLPHF